MYPQIKFPSGLHECKASNINLKADDEKASSNRLESIRPESFPNRSF